MPNLPPRITWSVLLGSLLALAPAQAVVECVEGGVSHFYGAKSRPRIEIKVEIEKSEDSPTYLSHHVIHFDKGQGLRITLEVRLETPQPDYYFSLDWDGCGFAVVRMEN